MAELVPVEPFDIVIFGATGDLALRKLVVRSCCRAEVSLRLHRVLVVALRSVAARGVQVDQRLFVVATVRLMAVVQCL